MSRITPFIYLGDGKDASNFNFLKSRRISLIVNCAIELPNNFPDQFSYIRLNWADDPKQPIIKTLDEVSSHVINEIKNKRAVFIHCAAGISRSAIFTIYIIMKLYNWNYDDAHRFIVKNRPIISPNEGFIRQLNEPPRIHQNIPEQNPKLPHPHMSRSPLEESHQNGNPNINQLILQDKLNNNIEPQQKNFKFTFDCPDCDKPDYERYGGRMYAKIF